MAAVLQRRLSPDEVRFGVAGSTTSYLLDVCGGCDIAFRVRKWPIKVGADSTEGYCIKAMLSFSIKVCRWTQRNVVSLLMTQEVRTRDSSSHLFFCFSLLPLRPLLWHERRKPAQSRNKSNRATNEQRQRPWSKSIELWTGYIFISSKAMQTNESSSK